MFYVMLCYVMLILSGTRLQGSKRDSTELRIGWLNQVLIHAHDDNLLCEKLITIKNTEILLKASNRFILQEGMETEKSEGLPTVRA